MGSTAVFVLILMIIFLIFISQDMSETKEGWLPSVGNKLPYAIKGIQMLLFVYIIWHMVEMIYFLYNHTFIIGFTAQAQVDAIAGYEYVIMTFSMMMTILFFFLLEISHKIASELKKEFKFSYQLIKRSKLILYILIIYIFTHLLMNAIIFESITMSIEFIVFYLLLLVLLRTFIRAVTLQYDNDMVI